MGLLDLNGNVTGSVAPLAPVGIRQAAGPGDFVNSGSDYFGLGGGIPQNTQLPNYIGNGSYPSKSFQDSMYGLDSNNPAGGKGSGGSGGKKKDNPPDSQARKEEIKKRSKKEKDEKLLKPPKPGERVKSVTSEDPSKYLGIKEMEKEGQSSGGNIADSFLTDDISRALQGMVQNMASQIPAMQQIMSMIPNEIFNQFLSNLPAELQSLLPVGTIAGAGFGNESMGNSINVQDLMKLVSGNPEMMNALQSLFNGGEGAAALNALQGIMNSNNVGMPQNIPADLARSLFNPTQLMSLLPGNLQNLIPMIAPLISTGAENLMSSIANAAPQQVPSSNEPGGGNGNQGCKTVDPMNDGKVNENTRSIDYSQMLSQNFSLHSLTIGSGIEPGKNMLNGDDIPKVVKNLSGLAENVLEPLRMQYPGFTILSGWRQEGDGHKDGKAVDVSWGVSPSKLTEIASYVQANIPAAEVKMIQQKIGWLHLTYDEGKCGAKATSLTPDGMAPSALIDYYSNNHKFF